MGETKESYGRSRYRQGGEDSDVWEDSLADSHGHYHSRHHSRSLTHRPRSPLDSPVVSPSDPDRRPRHDDDNDGGDDGEVKEVKEGNEDESETHRRTRRRRRRRAPRDSEPDQRSPPPEYSNALVVREPSPPPSEHAVLANPRVSSLDASDEVDSELTVSGFEDQTHRSRRQEQRDRDRVRDRVRDRDRQRRARDREEAGTLLAAAAVLFSLFLCWNHCCCDEKDEDEDD